jgi:hypothetical protein
MIYIICIDQQILCRLRIINYEVNKKNIFTKVLELPAALFRVE